MTAVHVLPLTDDHDESPECMCSPLPSLRVGDDRIYVHRFDTKYIEPSPFGKRNTAEDREVYP